MPGYTPRPSFKGERIKYVVEFQFRGTKEEFTIKDESGKVIKTYVIDVGNEKTLRDIFARYADLVEFSKGLEVNDESIGKMIGLERSIVSAVLSESDYEILWEECAHNVFAMLDLINSLAGIIQNAIAKFRKV